jgi:hypothetical protein
MDPNRLAGVTYLRYATAMRIHLAMAVAILCGGTLSLAQTQTPPPASQTPPAKDTSKGADDKPITLSGCVGRTGVTPSQFSLSDDAGQPVYHLTGTDVKKYFGQRVEIVGGVPAPKKLVIAGGLRPSPNVAAQAGDMDPSRAIVAGAVDNSGPGAFQLPEFRVKTVRPVSGSCP